MPSPYSEDLRQKAIAAVKRGERKKDVSEMFKPQSQYFRPVAQKRGTNWGLSGNHELPARV